MGILSSLIGPVADIAGKYMDNKADAAKMASEIATLAERQAHAEVVAQLEVNKTEAASQNMFVAGWRPAVGWTCCLGFFSNFIIVPFANLALQITGQGFELPMIDLSTMMPVLLGMLGLGGMRTVEKIKKVSREK